MQSCDCHMILDIVPQHMYQGPAFLFFRFVCCVYHVCVLEVLALLSNVSVARMLYIHVCFSMCLHIHSLYQLLGHRQSGYNYKGYLLSHRARSTSHSATERSLNQTVHILSSVSSMSVMPPVTPSPPHSSVPPLPSPPSPPSPPPPQGGGVLWAVWPGAQWICRPILSGGGAGTE